MSLEIRLPEKSADSTFPVGIPKLLAEFPEIIPRIEKNDKKVQEIEETRRVTGQREPYIHYNSLLENFYGMQKDTTTIRAYDGVIRSSINTALNYPHGRRLVAGTLPVIRAVLFTEMDTVAKGSEVYALLNERLEAVNRLRIEPASNGSGHPQRPEPKRQRQRRIQQITGKRHAP
jgi:hypothetical protein